MLCEQSLMVGLVAQKVSPTRVRRGELMSNIILASVVHHYKRTKIRV